jgi:hypothetical protein
MAKVHVLIKSLRSILLGPTIGGSLYDGFGWHGPLIFAIICLVVDLLGRMLIIDRDEALKYGIDPRVIPVRTSVVRDDEKVGTEATKSDEKPGLGREEPSVKESASSISQPKQHSLISIIIRMGKSPKALAPLICAFVYGYDPYTNLTSFAQPFTVWFWVWRRQQYRFT